MTHDEWLAKGKELFGEDTMNWKFICPACHTVQSAQDFKEAGVSSSITSRQIAYSCIGRRLPQKQKAFSEKTVIKGQPCDYTSGGLFNINPVTVMYPDGTIDHAFDFYESQKWL